MALGDRLRDDAQALSPDLVRLRHTLHQTPEIGLRLPMTQETVLRKLDGLGLEVTTGEQVSSVTAVLRGEHPGPAVLLRADMDALAVTEVTGLDFASRTDGVMHACGHDLHTAMLVGAARLLAAHRDEVHGDVVLMFQPGEEGWDGATVETAGVAGRTLVTADDLEFQHVLSRDQLHVGQAHWARERQLGCVPVDRVAQRSYATPTTSSPPKPAWRHSTTRIHHTRQSTKDTESTRVSDLTQP